MELTQASGLMGFYGSGKWTQSHPTPRNCFPQRLLCVSIFVFYCLAWLHNNEQYLYSSPSIIRMRMRRTGHVERIAENSNAYRLLVGKAEGNSY
jgi:hypothetical protein